MKWPFPKPEAAKREAAPREAQQKAPDIFTLRELYRSMFQARCVDETEAKLVARGEAFFHVPGAGHEGSAVLNAFLTPEDYLHLHYRDKALMIARGIPPEQFFNSLFCNAESHSRGRQMSAHMSNPGLRILSIVGPVGNNALQSVGVAARLKGQDPSAIVVCSMGDGTTQQGEVLEAIGEAVRSHLPVLFLIEDNRYAISTRTKGQTFYSTPGGEAAQFYGLPIHRVDGRDPVSTYMKFGPIVAGMRATCEPALILFQVERLAGHSSADDERKYRSEEEIRTSVSTADPLKSLAGYLRKEGVPAIDLQSTETELRAEVESASRRALSAWTAEPAKDAKRPLRSPNTSQTDEPLPANGEAKLTMLEAIREVLNRRLAQDPRVTIYGEDIEDPKGDVFGITRGLTRLFPGRVLNSALSESTIVGVSIGRALAGGRPVACIQFADFLPLAFNQILCELSTMYWRTAGGWECPVIIMAPCSGFRPGLGPFHAQTMESVLAHAPGLDVFMPSNATDAAGLLNAAFDSGRPTVFLYPKVCLNGRESLAAPVATQLAAPVGKARFLSRGSDLTLVTWGATVSICQKVAEALSSARISVDLIDLRSISPWDREAVCESAEKTGTLVVVHEDNLTAGFGAEILAAVSESVPKLIATKRITRPDTYVPSRFANQLEVLPSFRRIIADVCELLGLELAWTSDGQDTEADEFVRAIGSSPVDRTVTVVAWKVKPGDIIAVGDRIAELEVDEKICGLTSHTAGTVEEILVLAGNSVPVGTPILKLHSTTAQERISPTILLQKGTPLVRRKETPPPNLNGALGSKPRIPSPSSGTFNIQPEEVAENTVVVDVTDNEEWMLRARWLTAEAYVALANPKLAIGIEDVYDVISGDEYDRKGRGRTLAAITRDPATGSSKISGTLRVVIGTSDVAAPHTPPLDAMSFVQPMAGWPHELKGLENDKIAEMGRFIIPSRYRTLGMRRFGVDVWLAQQLYDVGTVIIRAHRIRIVYAILPAYVVRLVPGIRLEEIDSQLRLEDPMASAVFEQFSLYWKRSRPKLFSLPDAPGSYSEEHATDGTLAKRPRL